MADWLSELAEATGACRLGRLSAYTLCAMRSMYRNYPIAGSVSAGPGMSRLMRSADSWFNLTLMRQDDWALLPALFQDDHPHTWSWKTINRAVRSKRSCELVERARMLGLAAAHLEEAPVSPAVEATYNGPSGVSGRRRPRVLDLSSTWAGPLAAHLLHLAGCEVTKVENPVRPDNMRLGEPQLYQVLNAGKAAMILDPSRTSDRQQLLSLIQTADIIIESARTRALKQLGIDADLLVSMTPGLVWLSITAHGCRDGADNWIGMGHDCGTAAGLTRALLDASGRIGFVGDALPDPMTGIFAAREAWRAFSEGRSTRLVLSMSGVAALALRQERLASTQTLDDELRSWANAVGHSWTPADRSRRSGWN